MRNRISQYYGTYEEPRSVEQKDYMLKYPKPSDALFLAFAIAFGARLGWAVVDILARAFD